MAARKPEVFEVLLSTLTELAACPSTVDDGTSALLTLLRKQNVIGETVVHKAAGYKLVYSKCHNLLELSPRPKKLPCDHISAHGHLPL